MRATTAVEALEVRCLLFVPGNRPERFPKALASGADLVCLDLEDSVPVAEKEAARGAVLGFARDLAGTRVAVRINRLASHAGLRDVLALGEALPGPLVVCVPKVESAAELELMREWLPDERTRFAPIIENAEGLAQAASIAATPGCAALIFGGGDYALEIGASMAWEPLLAARSAIVMASARAGLPAIDVPFIQMDDQAGLAAESLRVRQLGFSGKVAIHPRQVPIIQRTWLPSAPDLEEARAALAAYEAAGRRAISFGGRLLEGPIVRRYEKMIAQSRELGE
jgi:(S)-citramalyl-CoA lyase